MSLRIAVVGAGALGLYYGARLAQTAGDTDNRVAFLARSDADVLASRGIIVRSIDGDFTLAPDRYETYREPAELAAAGPVDLILVGLKTTANQNYARLLGPLFQKDRSVILCLQNGIGNEAALAELFPRDRILGGTAFLCSNRVGPAEIEHTEHGLIHLAPYARHFSAPRAELEPAAVCERWLASGIDCDLRPNYVEMRWRKQIWNVPFNALCTIHDAATDGLLADQGNRERIAAIMREVIQLGARINERLARENETLSADQKINCGEYRLAAECETIVAEQLAKTETMGDYKPSMLLDFRAGRPIEYDSIIGACMRERDRYAPDFALPQIEQLARELRSAVA